MNFEHAVMNIGKYSEILSQYPYLYAVVIFGLFLAIAMSITFVFEKYLEKMAKKANSKISELIVEKIKTPITLILLLAGIRLAIVPLDLSATLVSYLSRGLSTAGIFIGILLSIIIFDVIIEGWALGWARRRRRIEEDIVKLFRRISRIVLFLIGLLFILDVWNINPTPLVASLGVAGIAIAFAMQKTLGNLFGGISLIVDKAIKVGDVIEISSGEVGTIVDIGLRSTKLKTFDNEIITIPNGVLAEQNVRNYALPGPTARLVIPFGVAYGSDVEKVKKTVLKAVKNIDGVSKEQETEVRFSEMADSALLFKVYIWVVDYKKRFSIKSIANTNIYNALNKENIVIPFPQMDVHLKKK